MRILLALMTLLIASSNASMDELMGNVEQCKVQYPLSQEAENILFEIKNTTLDVLFCALPEPNIACQIVYGKTGTYGKYEDEVETCCNTLMDENMWMQLKKCVPEAIYAKLSGVDEAEDKDTMIECTMKEKDLPYSNNPQENVVACVNKMLEDSDLDDVVKSLVLESVEGDMPSCTLPEEPCISDHFKMFGCVMDACVSTLYVVNY